MNRIESSNDMEPRIDFWYEIISYRYVICNEEGLVLRRMPSMSQELTEKYARHLNILAKTARHVTRDLNPKDDLKNLRIRTKDKELIVSVSGTGTGSGTTSTGSGKRGSEGDGGIIIIAVIQQWTPYSSNH